MSRIEYPVEALVPAEWQIAFAGSDFFTYNPSILRYGGQTLMLYRVVTRHYRLNHMATCLLDAEWRVVVGSPRPLFAPEDPGAPPHSGDGRFFEHASRLWAMFNDEQQPNMIMLSEVDPQTRQAVGRARPLVLDGRMLWEKNWMPFSHDGHLWVLYTIHPQVILRLDLSDPQVVRCERTYQTRWDDGGFSKKIGEWHGGNAPTLHEGLFWVFPHMVSKVSIFGGVTALLRQWVKKAAPSKANIFADGDVRLLQKKFDEWHTPTIQYSTIERLITTLGRRILFRHYVLGAYAFEARPPFAPRLFSYRPILRASQEPCQKTEPLEITRPQVVFAGGALMEADGHWRLAYGLHDEFCVIRSMSQGELLRHCRPVKILAEG